mgnify:CR=1 FL=1
MNIYVINIEKHKTYYSKFHIPFLLSVYEKNKLLQLFHKYLVLYHMSSIKTISSSTFLRFETKLNTLLHKMKINNLYLFKLTIKDVIDYINIHKIDNNNMFDIQQYSIIMEVMLFNGFRKYPIIKIQ